MLKAALLLLGATCVSAVIKGYEPGPNDFPWQVGVLLHKEAQSEWCGGALIHERWVLTSATCMKRAPAASVMTGATDISKPVEVMPVSEITIHPKFSGFFQTWDFALLRLQRAVKINEQVQPIRLPSWAQKKKSFKKVQATMCGWGRDGKNEVIPRGQMKAVQLKVISNFDCWWHYPLYLGDTNICTSSKDGLPCEGDEGGALFFTDTDGLPTLIGISAYEFSWGCLSLYPAVYARVTEALQWIQDNSDVTIRDA